MKHIYMIVAGAITMTAACTQEKEVDKYFNVNAATPQILAQPQNKSVLKGKVDSLKVEAFVSTEATLSYKWFKGLKPSSTASVEWGAATVGTERFFPIPTGEEGTFYYRVEVTSTDESAAARGGRTKISVMSNTAEVKVGTKSAPKPVFSTGLKDVEQKVGSSNVLFEIKMAAASEVIKWKYEWKISDSEDGSNPTALKNPVEYDTTGRADKGTSDFYVYDVPADFVGTKYIFVTATAVIEGAGDPGVLEAEKSAVSKAKIRSYAAFVKIKELKDISCTAGESKSFSVTTEGKLTNNTLSYQWERKNPLGMMWEATDSTRASLSVNTDFAKEETYRVTVRSVNANPVDTFVVTKEVKLTVKKKVAKSTISGFTKQSDGSIKVTATGNGTLTYEWHKVQSGRDSKDTQVTGDTYATPAGGYCYYVIVYDEIATETESAAKGKAEAKSSNVCINS